MPDSKQFVSSGQALEILRRVANRPKASRASLKYLVDTGCLQALTIHARCKVYDAAQIEAVAAWLMDGAE